MDFVQIVDRQTKNGIEFFPEFIIGKSKDLMIRGNRFYAFWDEENKVWCMDENRCTYLIDQELLKRKNASGIENCTVKFLKNASTKSMVSWKQYIKQLSIDNFVPLDSTLVFSNTEKKKELYSSHSLSYALAPGDYSAYDELVSVLYSPEERNKLEWIIGSIVTGESKNLQKFVVLTGDAGTGKSTMIKIIRKLFDGYCTVIDAKALGNPNASFPLESLKSNPLVAFQDDTDLSKIKDNTKLNSLVSHEPLEVNEKFANKYSMTFSCILILGSNEEVKISDARSGIQRRLIDIRPTGKKVSFKRYNKLMKQIDFELGAIAWHCKEVFESDPEKYLNYRPSKAIRATNYTYNFLEENYIQYKKGVTLKRVWSDYQKYCEDSGITYPLNKLELKKEVSAYFSDFLPDTVLEDGTRVYSYFKGILPAKFGLSPTIVTSDEDEEDYIPDWLKLKTQHSLLDDIFSDYPAQYSKLKDGQDIPVVSWSNCKTTLKDIDTTKVHYVLPDAIYICIDFDLKDENGNKCLQKNLRAASNFPKTYCETSKGGEGLHLIYIYNGDVSTLAFLYDEDIEVKVYTGKASMRRRVSLCNDIPVTTISSNLPLKGGKRMVGEFVFKSLKELMRMIYKNLKKEILPSTRQSVDLIYKDLNRAYEQGLSYTIPQDMIDCIYDFAASSTHQSKYCTDLVSKMKFSSMDEPENVEDTREDAPIVFFDVEVYENLFICCYKIINSETVTKLINPSVEKVKDLLNYKLVGFNNLRYDNHIIWAKILGYTNERLYSLSQDLIAGVKGVGFKESKTLSYTDVWDFCSNKQSLKKWEIELGISHIEMGIPWDKPAPEEKWEEIADYCANDVRATEAVFLSKKGQADFKAREILADLAGMTVNDTTNSLTLGIVFGKDKNPRLVYTDLSEEFPGYEKVKDYIVDKNGLEKMVLKNMYRGTDVGLGGYVYFEPNIYYNVALIDVASMHPSSIIALNKLGDYTQRYADLKQARVYIKHGDYDAASKLFDGKLKKYLTTKEEAKNLSKALKLPLNSFYGISFASFKNPARDPRDDNNIIALRGALFMRTLQDEVQKRGFTVAHIKTDSIKIPEANEEIISFCKEFGKRYGYDFEHEATYSKMCLINGSTYIAKYDEHGDLTDGGAHANEWTATATEFQKPFVFKTLFSHEPIIFDDLCETLSVKQGVLYLDFNEGLPEGEYNYKFVGRVGRFCPIKPGMGGGELFREKDGKYYAATGTKGYRWMEAELVKEFHYEDRIDRSYYISKANKAIEDINKLGDFKSFVSDGPVPDYYKFDKVSKDPLEGYMNEPEPLPFD